ncbi:MAG: hypothetical protein ACFCGT_11190 [Sandaracinaceae bacterium]
MAFFYLTAPDSMEIVGDVWVYHREPAPPLSEGRTVARHLASPRRRSRVRMHSAPPQHDTVIETRSRAWSCTATRA